MARTEAENPSNDIELFRKNRQKRHKRRRIIRVVIILLILALIGGLIFFASRFDFSDISEIINNGSGQQPAGEPTGFPKKLFGERPIQFERSGGYLAMVTDSKIYLYSESGDTVINAPHSYTKPTMCSFEKRVLLYDRGGNDLRLESDRGTQFEREMPGEIICGAINSQGVCAIATTEDRYAGSVTVFNAQNKELFKWFSSDEQINGITLRDDGMMAVRCIGAKNGAILSTVYLMNITQGENQKVVSVPFTDMMILSASFKDNGTLCVIGDTETAMVGMNGDLRGEYVYEKNIKDYADGSGSGTALILSSSAYSEEEEIVFLDNSANRVGAKTVQRENKWLLVSGTDVFALSDASVIRYDQHMNQQREYAARVDTTKIAVIGDHVYALGLGEISLLS